MQCHPLREHTVWVTTTLSMVVLDASGTLQNYCVYTGMNLIVRQIVPSLQLSSRINQERGAKCILSYDAASVRCQHAAFEVLHLQYDLVQTSTKCCICQAQPGIVGKIMGVFAAIHTSSLCNKHKHVTVSLCLKTHVWLH